MKPIYPLSLLVLIASAAAPLRAETFSLLVYESATELARRDGAGASAYWNAYSAFAADLASAGVLRGGTALTPPTEAGSTPQLGGYFIVEVADAAAAQALAAKAPKGVVHVTVAAHRDNPNMSPTR